MKAITVRQPWAYAIMHLGKDVENRTCNIAGSYRGPRSPSSGAPPKHEGTNPRRKNHDEPKD